MTELQIKGALIALLDGIKTADAQAISQRTAELDEIVARCRLGLPPQLVHFLERRSYAKALQYLGAGITRSSPRGHPVAQARAHERLEAR